MKRILIDTNVYSDFKRNDVDTVKTLQRAEYIGINVIVLGELLSGFKGGSKERRNIEELTQFLDSSRVHLIQIDEETAEFYADIYSNLKKKGKPIPSNDIWVSASAMRFGLPLFTSDEHFKHIDGLILQKVIL